ncbi:MAG: ADP-ribosylglycohydrolase family protein [Candidatus Hodarchaeales archaeon]|jgi:ADP-ribosylglycohydrolase
MKNKFIGCLIGQAVGDALGYYVEGNSSKVCSEYIDNIFSGEVSDIEKRLPSQFGQYTDDTQLARELLQSFVECQEFDPKDYARRIASIFAEKRIVGFGHATSQAAEKLIAGDHWQDSGTPPPYAGNGSAMRAGPIGLIFWDNSEKLIKAAINQGIITHRDPRCSAGAIAISGAVLLAINNKIIKQDKFLIQLQRWTEPISSDMASGINHLNLIMKLSPEEAYREIKLIGVDSESFDFWFGISPFVISSVLWSLYSFVKFPNNYVEAIKTAIRVGGDVDTTAAMTGAISGAFLGVDAIPLNVSKYLNDNGTWNKAQLVRLATECWELVTLKSR